MIIGVDIGGTWIKAVKTDGRKIIGQRVETPKSLPAFKKALVKLIEEVAEDSKIKGIGLGVAGRLTDTKIVSSANLKYLNGFALPKFLSGHFKVPVKMDNDARAYTAAELAWGDLHGVQNGLAITLGTGLGGGVVCFGRVLHGAHNAAGQISNLHFGNSQLEDYASLKFLDKNNGTFKEMGGNLAKGLVSIANIIDPEVIVLGGGLMIRPEIAKAVMSEMKKAPFKNKVKIKQSGLGHFAGALGATLLVDKF